MKIICLFLNFCLSIALFAGQPKDLEEEMRKRMKRSSDFHSAKIDDSGQNDKLQISTDEKKKQKLENSTNIKIQEKLSDKKEPQDLKKEMTNHMNQPQGILSSKRRHKKGYIQVKKGGIYLHAFVPETYNKDKKMPLMIALHRQDGIGESFLPNLQLNTKGQELLLLCPDSADQWTWETMGRKRKENILIIKKSLRYMKKNYNVDENKIYLLGQGAGGHFVLSLLCKDLSENMDSMNILKQISGVIISGADARIELENDIWELPSKGYMENAFPKPDVFLLGSKSDYIEPIVNVRWTRDCLRGNGYKVKYYEGEWEGYPVSLNGDIYSWCYSDNKENEDKKILNEKNQTGVTGQFLIHQILKYNYRVEPSQIINYKAAAKSNYFFNSYYMTPKTSHDKKNEKDEKNIYNDLPDESSGNQKLMEDYQNPRNTFKENRYTTSISLNRYGSRHEFNDLINDVRLVFMAFDSNKEQISVNEWRFTGFDPGDKNIRDYKMEKYGTRIIRSEKQEEINNSVHREEFSNVQFYTPYNCDDKYVCFMVYKGGSIAALRMYPEGTDHTEFPDLKHIVLKPGSQS